MTRGKKRRLSRWLLPILLAIVAIAVLSALARGADLLRALATFRLVYLLPALGLALSNYLLRFLRWHAYLRRCGAAPAVERSAAVFVSGLTMSVTPGKFGELFKSALLKQSDDVPVSLSAPVILVERIGDLAAVLGLAALGAGYYSVGRVAVVAAAVLLAAIVLPLTLSPGVVAAVAPWLARRRMLSAVVGDSGARSSVAAPPGAGAARAAGVDVPSGALERVTRVFALLLRGRMLVLGLLLGALAWMAEGMALFLVLAGFGEHGVPAAAVIFIYALATLAGALSMLPGGLGATEASMAGLLIGFGVSAPTAAAATLVVRACTLWFAVVVGLAGYAVYGWLCRSAPPRRGMVEARTQ